MQHRAARQEIIAFARAMNEAGINQGTSGNLSLRLADRFLITPSGIPYAGMLPEDIVEVTFGGRVIGPGTPSSEWLFHRDILVARPEVNAVLHAHSMFATVLACQGRDIPAFHYMVAVAGGDSIRCAPYALFGSQALSDVAIQALFNRRACLLANHGLIAVGDSLQAAFSLAVEVETLAAQYCRALQTGQPRLLNEQQMKEVLERFKSYGNRAKATPRVYSN